MRVNLSAGAKPIDSLDYKLTFGKYKGRTIQQIIEDDPRYLNWADETINWFNLSPRIHKMVTDAVAETAGDNSDSFPTGRHGDEYDGDDQ